MRRFLRVILFLVVGFVLGVVFREVQGEIKAKREAKKRQYSFSTQPVLEEKPFVILMFEDGTCIEESLISVLHQEYTPFRVIYIGQGKKRGKTFLQNYDHEGKVTYVEKTEGKVESELLYQTIHSCQNNEIVVLLRGGEFFSHPQVLSTLNKHFADPDIWMTTSQEFLCPTYENRWSEGYYQSFYVGLAKQIKLEEFLIEGKFKVGDYEEILFPSLQELSGTHAFGIPAPLFVTSRKRKKVERQGEIVHTPFKEYPWHDFSKDEEWVDLLIFSDNRPLQLYAFLESTEKHLENLHQQYVIYRAGNDHYEKGYGKVKEAFPNVIYIRQPVENPYEDFAPLVRKTIFDRNISTARYISFAFDDLLIKESIDLKKAIGLLKETGAHGFYFCLGNNLKGHPKDQKLLVQEGVFGWQFSTMDGEWKVPNSLKMTLFKKGDIKPDFINMKFHNPNSLEALWNEGANLSRIGLYYDRSKVVILPLNIAMENKGGAEKISTKELLSYFDQGLKVNTIQVEQIENESIDVPIKPTFIQR